MIDFTRLLVLTMVASLAVAIVIRPRIWASVRDSNRLQRRMDLASNICVASARDAFGIELGGSLGSVARLDDLITRAGWGNAASGHQPLETRFALGAYLGEIFVRSQNAQWIPPTGKSPDPLLNFPKSSLNADPFAMLDERLRHSAHSGLVAAVNELQREVTIRGGSNRRTAASSAAMFVPGGPEDQSSVTDNVREDESLVDG